jgi:hypothetical protein
MGNIKCADGGRATAGETFNFENHSDAPCILAEFSGFMTVATNPVPAKTEPGGPGTSSATILTGLTAGDYQYTASCRTNGNPTITVGIRCSGGGSVSPGEFLLINEDKEPCTLAEFSSFMTVATNPVPAKTDAGPGTSSATILTGIAEGDYPYTTSCNKKRSQPTIHVESGKP